MPKSKTITLRKARTAAGLTMIELARRAGVSPVMVESIESGRTPGSLINRHRLSDALGIPVRLMWPDSMAQYQELARLMKNGPDAVPHPDQPEHKPKD